MYGIYAFLLDGEHGVIYGVRWFMSRQERSNFEGSGLSFRYKDVQPKIERFIEQQVNLMYLSSNLLRGITVFSFRCVNTNQNKVSNCVYKYRNGELKI